MYVVAPADSEDLTRLFNGVLEQEAPASHKAGENVTGLAFTVDGKPWDGNDLADPSALTCRDCPMAGR